MASHYEAPETDMLAPRAERRIVTCVLVDIVGSTDLTVSLGPERMRRLLAGAFGRRSEAASVEHVLCLVDRAVASQVGEVGRAWASSASSRAAV